MNRRGVLVAAAATVLWTAVPATSLRAQVSLSAPGRYEQNFDGLAGSGTNLPWTNDGTLPGWYAYRQPAPGTGLPTYSAGSGTNTAGSIYSFGTDADRAFGSVGSGGPYYGSPLDGAVAGWIAFGARNDTGRVITGFTLAFRGEQWRNGANNTSGEDMALEYGFGGTFGEVASWTAPGGEFDWASPVKTGSAGALDGNAAANQVPDRGGTVSGLGWRDGETLWVRWVERNHPGNDDGLAIDDFSLTVTAGEVSVADPTCFAAAANGTSAIHLSWALNGRSHPVLLAVSADGVFGTPLAGQAYEAGRVLPGGGTVLYSGTGTAHSDAPLSPGTLRRYRIWSFDEARNYSAGASAEARTDLTGLKIFHVNDVHSRLQPHDYDVPEIDDVPEFEQVGGAACLVARMLQLKSAAPDALVLDAGDISEGGPLGDLRGNGGMIDVYNLLDQKLKNLGGRGIDAAVVGNHDVRYAEMLANMRNNAHFPFISANIIDLATGRSYFPEHVIVETGGHRVGILGYTTDTSAHLGPETATLVRVATCAWDNAAAEIRIKDKVAELRTAHGCDIVVLLAHVGHSRVFSDDSGDGRYQLVKDSGGVKPPEAVIGGHWHTLADTVWQPAVTHYKTVVGEASSYMEQIGEIQLDEQGRYAGAQKHLIDNAAIPADPDVLALLQTLEAEYSGTRPTYALEQVVGHSAVDLRLNKNKWWMHNEFPWAGDNTAGAWIADAMAWRLNQPGPGIPASYHIDLAMQSGGGVRRDNAKGPLTYREIYETYPWRDDNMVVLDVKGQEIWNFIQNDYVGTSISQGWKVFADDGIIRRIERNGVAIEPAANFRIAVSSYMFSQYNDTAAAGWSDAQPETVPYSIRQSVLDYTSQFGPSNPMDVPGPRYVLDTQLAGRFRAVVTMTDDSESQPYHEAVWVRLLGATPDTVARRGGYVPADLVNEDGSINHRHQFAESMLYRSYLGFPSGVLVPGRLLDIEVEGGFYAGNPQLVEQNGVTADQVELVLAGEDGSLAQPDPQGCLEPFWDEWHENHLVKFQAEKVGVSRVKDRRGVEITVYRPGGYTAKTLPGNIGDQLELVGLQTAKFSERRFRCASAAVAHPAGSIDYPPYSSLRAIPYANQTGTPLLLQANASDATEQTFAQISPSDDAEIASGYPDVNFNFYQQAESNRLYLQSAIGTANSYGNQCILTKFSLAALPEGAAITSAKLRMYCFLQSASGAIRANAHAMADGWNESTVTWNGAWNFPETLVGPLVSSTQLFRENDQWYEWDVTPAVLAEWEGDRVASFLVKPEIDNAPVPEKFSFDSKAYSDGACGPFLEVQFRGYPTGGGTVTRVDFHYRFSTDNRTWSPWRLAGTDANGAPWQLNFHFPEGHGYYEFHSVAVDNTGNVEEAPVLADTRVKYESAANHAPAAPVLVQPALFATDVSQHPWLQVIADDPDRDALDVSFHDADTGALVGSCTGVAPGGKAQACWTGLPSGTLRRWYAVASDGAASTQSPVFSFLAGPPRFASWASMRIPDPGRRGHDFDGGDGVRNAFEYALNLDPDDRGSDWAAFQSMVRTGVDDPTPGIPGDEHLRITLTDPDCLRNDVTWRVVASNRPRDDAEAPAPGAMTQILASRAGSGPWVARAGSVRATGTGTHTILDPVTIGGPNCRRFIWAEVLLSP